MDGDAPVIKVEVEAVRLQEAVLCVDCNTISNSPHDTCSICGSRSLLPLSRVLGEKTIPVAAVYAPAAQRPGINADAVFVLTSPAPHRPRQRRRMSRG